MTRLPLIAALLLSACTPSPDRLASDLHAWVAAGKPNYVKPTEGNLAEAMERMK